MSKLDKAKEVIKKHINSAECGIFDCRNWAGDPMVNIYRDAELSIDICYGYAYYEVFGLNDLEFEQLEKYYYELLEENRNG